jgi:hypothetical protein
MTADISSGLYQGRTTAGPHAHSLPDRHMQSAVTRTPTPQHTPYVNQHTQLCHTPAHTVSTRTQVDPAAMSTDTDTPQHSPPGVCSMPCRRGVGVSNTPQAHILNINNFLAKHLCTKTQTGSFRTIPSTHKQLHPSRTPAPYPLRSLPRQVSLPDKPQALASLVASSASNVQACAWHTHE